MTTAGAIMKISILSLALAICSCGASEGQRCSIFRKWSLTSCSSACIALDLSGGAFGSNTVEVPFPDGAKCTLDVNVSSLGSNTSEGTGMFTNGRVDGSHTAGEENTCSSFNDLSFEWDVTCSQLTVVDAAGTAVYD